MLSVLSPAKSLDMESPLATETFTVAEFLDDSTRLIDTLKTKSPDELASALHISDNLAELNWERNTSWSRPTKPGKDSRQALLAFDGDVYKGMDAVNQFSVADYDYAQKTLRILSGLYGVLRPLDLIKPYRLEMGTKMQFGKAMNLYQFWNHTINTAVQEAVEQSPGEMVLVNLASNEYFKAVKASELDPKVISVAFLDAKDGGDHKVVSFFAKKARGAMAGWMIRNQVESVKELSGFEDLGYVFNKSRSSKSELVFTREYSS